MDDSACNINQIQNYASNPAAGCFLPVGRFQIDIAIILSEAFLATKSQEIVAQHSQKKTDVASGSYGSNLFSLGATYKY